MNPEPIPWDTKGQPLAGDGAKIIVRIESTESMAVAAKMPPKPKMRFPQVRIVTGKRIHTC